MHCVDRSDFGRINADPTKTRACASLLDYSFTPLADEIINQIKTVGVCQ